MRISIRLPRGIVPPWAVAVVALPVLLFEDAATDCAPGTAAAGREAIDGPWSRAIAAAASEDLCNGMVMATRRQ